MLVFHWHVQDYDRMVCTVSWMNEGVSLVCTGLWLNVDGSRAGT